MHHEPPPIDPPSVDVGAATAPAAAPLPLVLIVDDDCDTRAIHAEILRFRGFRTAEAEDGETGIEMAVSVKPDVILLDHSMPGMSGLEAAQRMKSDVRTRAIPIVMLTGFGSTARTRASSPVCDAYIVKPSMPDEVVATLRSVLTASYPSVPKAVPRP